MAEGRYKRAVKNFWVSYRLHGLTQKRKSHEYFSFVQYTNFHESSLFVYIREIRD